MVQLYENKKWNSGAVELLQNWSERGQTCHVDVRNHHVLRELKDLGLLMAKFVPSDLNDANIAQLKTLVKFGYESAANEEIIAASKQIRTELRASLTEQEHGGNITLF